MPVSKFLTDVPQKNALKMHFIEENRNKFSPDTLNCAAHLILYLDTPAEVMNIGLDYLVNKLSADRANGGFVNQNDKLYKSSSVRSAVNSDSESQTAFILSNNLSVFQKVWKQHKPVVCDSVDSLLLDSRTKLQSINSQSMMMQRLSFEGMHVGLACVDFVQREHVWETNEIIFMESFCDTFLGPLLAISKHWYSNDKFQAIKKPSSCELTAIRLAAKGLSYKQISRHLGKSVRTIENQLRNARSNMEAANLPELISKCEIWL